jgi:hypothetical protein
MALAGPGQDWKAEICSLISEKDIEQWILDDEVEEWAGYYVLEKWLYAGGPDEDDRLRV